MGVDYTAHYGIGVQIGTIDFDEYAELEYMVDYLEEKLDLEKYGYFEVGESNYGGDDNDFYVEVKEPFANGLSGLEPKRDELLKHLEKIGLTVIGEFGLIGGLEIH